MSCTRKPAYSSTSAHCLLAYLISGYDISITCRIDKMTKWHYYVNKHPINSDQLSLHSIKFMLPWFPLPSSHLFIHPSIIETWIEFSGGRGHTWSEKDLYRYSRMREEHSGGLLEHGLVWGYRAHSNDHRTRWKAKGSFFYEFCKLCLIICLLITMALMIF